MEKGNLHAAQKAWTRDGRSGGQAWGRAWKRYIWSWTVTVYAIILCVGQKLPAWYLYSQR